jgi:hypothetical protein
VLAHLYIPRPVRKLEMGDAEIWSKHEQSVDDHVPMADRMIALEAQQASNPAIETLGEADERLIRSVGEMAAKDVSSP